MTAPTLPAAIPTMMARREIRIHHYLWHEIRNMWLSYDAATQQQIRDLGWEPPRPARRPEPDGSATPIYDNASGEDFLYMHRQMIAFVNAKLSEIADPHYPRVQGWAKVPKPGDPDYPVPPAWDTGDNNFNTYLEKVKSDAFYDDPLSGWEKDLTSAAKLKGMSLGELGARIEFTIHNQMHMRWCSKLAAIRPDPNPPDFSIQSNWDKVAYNWLGDTYSSQVHPTFWKIHGWVDACIDLWKAQNSPDADIAWTGTWLGNMPEHPSPNSLHALLTAGHSSQAEMKHGHHDHASSMVELLRVVGASGKFFRFYDKINH